MMTGDRFLVIGRHGWNRAQFEGFASDVELTGQWEYLGEPKELTVENLARIGPRYIFFLHWSEKVPAEILREFECVCFHMTDVPFGRGGSPLQNLIVRGHRETVMTALRMTEEFDAGPVYLKRPMSLESSSAEEIYCRASRLSLEMASEIAAERPEPVAQRGEATVFRRRTPAESEFPGDLESLVEVHDFVRMLDAEGYPKAFLDFGGFRIEFSRSTLYHDRVRCEVTIRPRDKEEEG